MANQQHLDLLRQGRTVWNPWKAKQGPGFRLDLREADLREADLFRADLNGAWLSEAHLNGAYLSYAHLNGADLNGADLSGATIGRTTFCDLDLRHVQGLDTLKHVAPSSIGTDTLERSQGDLPDAFLHGVGLSDTFIAYAHSLVAHPIEYYTCFISYSSHDQDIAERLYADLQSNGVRCWFAPEDMKTEERMRERRDESIRLYDKLLLVLSEHSITSPWIKKEVETAFDKESRTNRLVLFPVRLDRTVIDTDQAWAADIRRTRHIGDFRQWKDHDAYQQSFARLLRDLQQSAPAQGEKKPDQR